MVRTIIIAGAALAALTAPTLAAEWNIIKENKPPESGYASPCFVAERNAAPGEMRVAGPFGTRELGMAAMGGFIVCNVRNEEGGRMIQEEHREGGGNR